MKQAPPENLASALPQNYHTLLGDSTLLSVGQYYLHLSTAVAAQKSAGLNAQGLVLDSALSGVDDGLKRPKARTAHQERNVLVDDRSDQFAGAAGGADWDAHANVGDWAASNSSALLVLAEANYAKASTRQLVLDSFEPSRSGHGLAAGGVDNAQTRLVRAPGQVTFGTALVGGVLDHHDGALVRLEAKGVVRAHADGDLGRAERFQLEGAGESQRFHGHETIVHGCRIVFRTALLVANDLNLGSLQNGIAFGCKAKQAWANQIDSQFSQTVRYL